MLMDIGCERRKLEKLIEAGKERRIKFKEKRIAMIQQQAADRGTALDELERPRCRSWGAWSAWLLPR